MRNSTRSLGLFVATGLVVASGLGVGVWRLSMPSSTTTTDTAISSGLVSTEDYVPQETSTSERYFGDQTTRNHRPHSGTTVEVSPQDPFLAPNARPSRNGGAAPQGGAEPRPTQSQTATPQDDAPSTASDPTTSSPDGGVNRQESASKTPSESRDEHRDRPNSWRSSTSDPSTDTETNPTDSSPNPSPATPQVPTLQPADPPLVNPTSPGEEVPTPDPNHGEAGNDDPVPGVQVPDDEDDAGTAPSNPDKPKSDSAAEDKQGSGHASLTPGGRQETTSAEDEHPTAQDDTGTSATASDSEAAEA
ncbi:hypothetical protein ACX3T8_11210 [Corynebacterium pyruviciproducens]